MTIHMTASIQVKEEALAEFTPAIEEFVTTIRDNKPGTLLYTSLQSEDDPTQFLHYFIFKNEAARDIHAHSERVNRFTDILYPRLIAPTDFTKHSLLTSTDYALNEL